MPQKMILKFPVKPETRTEFVEILVGAIPDTRAYEGCQRADVYTPEDDEANRPRRENLVNRLERQLD